MKKYSENTLRYLFDERVAANVAAGFLSLAGGKLDLLKLMKLMYLAERKSYELYAEPIIGDRLVSMDRGPVLSMTLDRMNGVGKQIPGGWDDWVSDKARHTLSLRKKLKVWQKECRMLSSDQVKIIEDIWEQFKDYGTFELVDYTHNPQNCPEWVDPEGSSTAIDLKSLFGHLGFNRDKIDSALSDLTEQAEIRKAFAFIEDAS